MIEQVKINHDFCTIKWFFIAQKDRCELAISLQVVTLQVDKKSIHSAKLNPSKLCIFRVGQSPTSMMGFTVG